MQQFFLDKDGREYAEIVELDYEEFIEESDRFESKMDSHDENAKIEKNSGSFRHLLSIHGRLSSEYWQRKLMGFQKWRS